MADFGKNCPVHGEVRVAGPRTKLCPKCLKDGKETAFIPKGKGKGSKVGSGSIGTRPASKPEAFPHGANNVQPSCKPIDAGVMKELASIAEVVGGWRKLNDTVSGDTIGKVLSLMQQGISLDDLREVLSRIAAVKN